MSGDLLSQLEQETVLWVISQCWWYECLGSMHIYTSYSQSCLAQARQGFHSQCGHRHLGIESRNPGPDSIYMGNTKYFTGFSGTISLLPISCLYFPFLVVSKSQHTLYTSAFHQ